MKNLQAIAKTVTCLLLITGLLYLSLPASVAAQNVVYKWLQPYDLENGIDIASYDYQDATGARVTYILADDWLCSDDRPVSDIHWWGSYWEINADGGLIPYTGAEDPYYLQGSSPQFMVQIHKDIPAGVGGVNYSQPGEVIWSRPTAFIGSYVGQEGNPDMGGATKFAWHWLLDEDDWFRQEDGDNIYWLSVYQILGENDNYLWGWETSSEFWNDDAVVWNGTAYQPVGEHVGLAFGLTTVPVPAAVWLLASGFAGLLGIRWRRRE